MKNRKRGPAKKKSHAFYPLQKKNETMEAWLSRWEKWVANVEPMPRQPLMLPLERTTMRREQRAMCQCIRCSGHDWEDTVCLNLDVERRLSAREKQVFDLIFGEGVPYREAAKQLDIASPTTIGEDVKRILEKVGEI